MAGRAAARRVADLAGGLVAFAAPGRLESADGRARRACSAVRACTVRGGPRPPRFLRGGAGRGRGTVCRRVVRRICRRVYNLSLPGLPPALLPFVLRRALVRHLLARGVV